MYIAGVIPIEDNEFKQLLFSNHRFIKDHAKANNQGTHVDALVQQ